MNVVCNSINFQVTCVKLIAMLIEKTKYHSLVDDIYVAGFVSVCEWSSLLDK